MVESVYLFRDNDAVLSVHQSQGFLSWNGFVLYVDVRWRADVFFYQSSCLIIDNPIENITTTYQDTKS